MEKKEKIYFIFNNEKESFHSQMQKAFKEYLKDAMKENKAIEMQGKQVYNDLADDC